MSSRAAVIFDLDGTLVDSLGDIAWALNSVLAELGRPALAPDAVVPLVGEGPLRLIERAIVATGGPDAAIDVEAALADYLDAYARGALRTTTLYPGARETLAALAKRRYALAVCTNKLEGLALEVLRGLDVLDYFPVVVGADTLEGARKPDPRLLEPIFEGLCATADTTVLIGDSATDVALARAGRLRSVVLREGGYAHAPVASMGADRLFSDFAELPEMLDALFA